VDLDLGDWPARRGFWTGCLSTADQKNPETVDTQKKQGGRKEKRANGVPSRACFRRQKKEKKERKGHDAQEGEGSEKPDPKPPGSQKGRVPKIQRKEHQGPKT